MRRPWLLGGHPATFAKARDIARGDDPRSPPRGGAAVSWGSHRDRPHSLVEHWLFGPRVNSRPLVRPLGGMERGSEGSAGRARCWVLRERPLGPLGQDRLQRPARAHDSRDRPYLENCTVDASITYVFAKLLRAHGGCLGTRSR